MNYIPEIAIKIILRNISRENISADKIKLMKVSNATEAKVIGVNIKTVKFVSDSEYVNFDYQKMGKEKQLVWYFISAACCVFQPAFGCLQHQKAGRNIFSAVFQPFLFITELF